MLTFFPSVLAQVFLPAFNGALFDGGAHGIVPTVQVAKEGNNPQHFHDLTFVPI